MPPSLADLSVVNGICSSKLADNGVAPTLNQTASLLSSNDHLDSHANGGHISSLAELDYSILRTEYTVSRRTPPVKGSAEEASQSVCTDHMITCSWTQATGWGVPELQPYGALTLMPTASCLHYATECFEGMKLYRGYDGKLRLFRPSLNANRMRMSAARIALPSFNPDELIKLITKLCATDGPKWLPRNEQEISFTFVQR